MLAPKWMRNNERGIFWAVMIALVFLLGAGTAVVANDGITELDVIFIFGVALALALFAILRLRGSSSADDPAVTPAAAVEPAVEDGPTELIRSPRRRFQHLQWPPTLYRGTARAQIPGQPRRHLASVNNDPADTGEFLASFHRGLREDTGGYPPVPGWGEEAP